MKDTPLAFKKSATNAVAVRLLPLLKGMALDELDEEDGSLVIKVSPQPLGGGNGMGDCTLVPDYAPVPLVDHDFEYAPVGLDYLFDSGI